MKKDLLELQREAGITYDDGAVVQKVYAALLVFERNREAGKQGVISTFENRWVFVDKDHHGEIAPGEAWICSLIPYNGYSGQVYYATPLSKVDEGLVMRLQPEIAKGIEDRLWEKHRSLYDSKFDSKAREEMTRTIQAALEEKHKADIASKDATISDLENRVRELRNKLAEGGARGGYIGLSSDEIVLTSEEQPPLPAPAQAPASGKGTTDETTSAVARTVSEPGVQQQAADLFGIGRRAVVRNVVIRGDDVSCPDFPDGNYFVHISPDKKRLLIRYNEHGGVICRNGTMAIHGLRFMPGCGEDEENRPDAEYSSRLGGVLINL